MLKIRRRSTAVATTSSPKGQRVRWKQLILRHAGRIDVEAAQRFEPDHFDPYLGEEHAGERSLCGHWEMEARPIQQWPTVPNGPWGTIDAKVVDSKMAKRMSFAARWGSACGTPFDAAKFLFDHPQFEWMKDILQSRPSEAWADFASGE